MKNDLEKTRSDNGFGRFLPFLMARLRDDEPQNRIDRSSQLNTSVEQLRKSIMDNLELILNTRARMSVDDVKSADIVKDSVLFVGLQDSVGRPHSTFLMEELRQKIIHQIQCFEPRISKDSIEVILIENPEYPSDINMRINGTIAIGAIRNNFSFERKIAWSKGSISLLSKDHVGGNNG